MAILVAVAVLLQLQTCDSLPFANSGSSGSSAKKAAAGKRASSKAPALIPPAAQERVLAQASAKFVEQRTSEIARIDGLQRETFDAYAHMDGRRAAAILKEMNPLIAVEILAHLEERDIARILEEADPADAAAWTVELLKRPEFTPVPDALKDAAARAGLYDNLPDLLNEAGVAPADGSAADGSAAGDTNSDTTAAGTDASGEALPADAGAADGTAAPGDTSPASPAASPSPPGGATAEGPPAVSAA